MNKNFTFGVLAYNQEKEIITTLNSIKYQIETYGAGYSCNLIITDDCSKDKTVSVCKLWLEKHEEFFVETEIKTNKSNVGTVINYNYILSKIHDDPFKIVAGDDLISHNNIFKTAFSVGKHTLFCGLKIMFKGNTLLLYDEDVYRQFYLFSRKRTVKNNLNLLKLGFCISTPQTLYWKALYDDSKAKLLNTTFRLFEDNPTWYSMLTNVEDIEVEFAKYPIVIYRLSEKSVSNSVVKVNTVFKDELNRLYDIYQREGLLFDRLYFESMKKQRPNCFSFANLVKKLFRFKCRLYVYFHYKSYKLYRDNLEMFVKEEKTYFKELIEREGLTR